MLKMGHRGAKGYEPENTLKSFQKAIDLGCDGIELDVHLSSDGELMVVHDATIDRTTNSKGKVNFMTSAALKQFNIPTLNQVLELVKPNFLVNIELKSFETVEKVIEIIEKNSTENNWNYSSFLVSSFDWKALEKVRFLSPKIQIGVLTEDHLQTAFEFAKQINAYSIHPYFKLLNEENTAKLQNSGFKIYTWTVNNQDDIDKMKSLKVDGIISDFPDRI
jgi:glycerophosphoryl diester phosphodiesterase